MKRTLISCLVLILASTYTYNHAQNKAEKAINYIYPLDIPAILSSNFGELRANHFHSGIDLKTQGVINKPVRSVEDGYVSRIGVSSYGYGLALYVDHPKTGHTSVYAHLEKYAPKIAKYTKDIQYERESFTVDIRLEKGELPIKKGELIAYSGNTGSSGGPHVHFELRTTKNQAPIDPLPYYKNLITDNVKPQIRGIAVYPISGEGSVNNSREASRYPIRQLKNGLHSTISQPIKAWGKIGLGIHAIDKMNKANNIYGVKKTKIYVDNKPLSTIEINSYTFDETRMINSLTDFDYWKRQKSFYMRSYAEDGNTLPVFKELNNDGYITIDKEKTYNIRYELEDVHGNQTSYSFNIIGQKQEIPPVAECTQALVRNGNNYFITEDFSLIIDKDLLYSDIGFTLAKDESDKYLSNIYHLNYNYVPLHDYADISIEIRHDTLTNKKNYGILRIVDGKESWVGGVYNNGAMAGRIRELGDSYAISYDDKEPSINPINPTLWISRKQITINANDDLSGIKSYRGTIDGKYVLFEHDGKSTRYHYYFDDERLEKDKEHELIFTVVDAAGNSNNYTHNFKY